MSWSTLSYEHEYFQDPEDLKLLQLLNYFGGERPRSHSLTSHSRTHSFESVIAHYRPRRPRSIFRARPFPDSFRVPEHSEITGTTSNGKTVTAINACVPF